MKILAVEGINGSGKTPTIRYLKSLLNSHNISTGIYAPYHLVKAKIDLPDIYPLWEQEPEWAVSLLHEVMDEAESDAKANDHDVLIYDRHWTTAFTQAEKNPVIKTAWGERFVPTILFSSPLSHAKRLANRGYSAEWLSLDSIKYYINLYEQVAKQYPQLIVGRFSVSSAAQDLHIIATQIFQTVIDIQEI